MNHHHGSELWRKLRKILAVLAFCASLLQTVAVNTNIPPVKLAIIARGPQALAAAEFLTAELSKAPGLELFERDQIEKIMREQNLSTTGEDALKLGRIAGAEGLVLIDASEREPKPSLLLRVLSVRIGIVLRSERMPLPADLAGWAPGMAKTLAQAFPKLHLPLERAVPLSIVNFRSPVDTHKAREEEAQLTMLVAHRLSQQDELLVLERERMQELMQEKDLSGDASAFWNGAYLLEGNIDPGGYQQDVITATGFLRQPGAVNPVAIKASGSRTNLAEVANNLAIEILRGLKVTPRLGPWSSVEESAKFLTEAQWALRWKLFRQAQAAADAAWALGKQDMECAMVRVQASMMASQEDLPELKSSQTAYLDDPSSARARAWEETAVEEFKTQHPFGCFVQVFRGSSETEIICFFYEKLPTIVNAQHARRALDLYLEESSKLPKEAGEPGHPWYALGIRNLVAAGQVLGVFHLAVPAQSSAREELAELRAAARAVADWLINTKASQDAYFFGDRVITHEQLASTPEFQYSRQLKGQITPFGGTVFPCLAKWGALWQETPEDCLRLYRGLLKSPAFCYLHNQFWIRSPNHPWITSWSDLDRKRAPQIWSSFVSELAASTNVIHRAESLGLICANNPQRVQAMTAFTNLVDLLLTNSQEFVRCNADLMYENWQLEALLVQDSSRGYGKTWAREYFQARRKSFEELHRQYHQRLVFEKQKAFLASLEPYDRPAFLALFHEKQYSAEQATELLPYLSAYRSNLISKAELEGSRRVSGLEKDILRLLGSNAPSVQASSTPLQPAPPKKAAVAVTRRTVPAIRGEMLTARNVFTLPPLALPGQEMQQLRLFAPHVYPGDNKLWLELQYRTVTQEKSENMVNHIYKSPAGSAVLDPNTGKWELFEYPGIKDHFWPAQYGIVFQGSLFLFGHDRLCKRQLGQPNWEIIEVPWRYLPSASVVNGRLLVTTTDYILEIAEGGKRINILASSRRRPALSVLDSLPGFKDPRVFRGDEGAICASVGNKVYSLMGDDWKELLTLPFSAAPEIHPGGTIFRTSTRSEYEVWVSTNGSTPVIAFHEPIGPWSMLPSAPLKSSAKPLWKLPKTFSLSRSGGFLTSSNLYLFESSLSLHTNSSGATPNKRCVQFACFTPGNPTPIELSVSLERPQGDDSTAGFPLEVYEQLPKPTILGIPAWWVLGSEHLFVGYEQFPGVWSIPISEVDAALTRIKTDLQNQADMLRSIRASRRSNLLAKYDQDSNRKIDPGERTSLDDPDLIQEELALIDANKNYLIDPDELAFFDGNQNRKLDDQEKTGIEIAARCLAEKIMEELDLNSDGILRQSEFNDLPFPNSFSSPVFSFQDTQNGWGIRELQSYIIKRLVLDLHPRSEPGRFRAPMAPQIPSPSDNERLKTLVEDYWSNNRK